MEKAERVQALFQSEFTSRKIEHLFESHWHKYKIIGQPVHWLCVDDEFLEKEEPRNIVLKARDSGAIYELKSSDDTKWIHLNRDGAEEVDEQFVKKS